MKKTTKQAIIDLINKHEPISSQAIVKSFDMNHTIIFRHLKDLIEQGYISKLGTPPKVFYVTKHKDLSIRDNNEDLQFNDIQRLNTTYLSYDSDGTLLYGYEGFVNRCKERNLSIKEQYIRYKSMIESIDKLKNSYGLIDVSKKMKEQHHEMYLEKVYVSDTYQVGQFGKSKIGSLAFYAKQSQNLNLAHQIIDNISRSINRLIEHYNIQAVCFAPVSLKRQLQLMDVLNKNLVTKLPRIKLFKLFPNEVIIPQKSIKGTPQRIKNATNTIFVQAGQKKYHNILLIDDFIGSGATLNISAKKIKASGLAKKIIGYSLVGNIDLSYDVINEI